MFQNLFSGQSCSFLTTAALVASFGTMIAPSKLVLAGTTTECGDFSAAIADCTDVSPRVDSFPIADNLQQSVSGRMLTLTVSSDGETLYTASFSGVWRSDDAGETWRQLTRPQPPHAIGRVRGSLKVPNVFDVVVSPVNKELVLAATANDTRVPSQSANGIYRSGDGGDSWRLVHQFKCAGSQGAGPVAQIVFAPDNPRLIYAAGGCAIAISRNGGWTWFDRRMPDGGTVWHVAVAPRERARHAGFIRRVYAAGDDQIWYSEDGGNQWFRDTTTVLPIGLGEFTLGAFPGSARTNSSRILAVEPNHPDHVYLAIPALANGPSYYHPTLPDGTPCNDPTRGCGEGSLWLGDYSSFFPGRSAHWEQLPGPPAYFGGSTDSGRVYVVAHLTPDPSGYLLFFADRAHVHVSEGRPVVHASWHRLDGRDISQSKLDNDLSNKLFVHVDPQAIAVSADLDIALAPATGVDHPYDQNSVLAGFFGGAIWMANDGGVYRSIDGGGTWQLGNGLSTLQPLSRIAGIALPGHPPAFYFGVPDNDNFFSLDGGKSWRNHPIFDCGDCQPWFADPAQPDRVLSIEGPDRGGIAVDMTNTEIYPNGTKFHIPPFPSGFQIDFESGVSISKQGYRPIILTLSDERPLPDGDYILIRRITNEKRVLLRTTEISRIRTAGDWDRIPIQQGPDLIGDLSGVYVVQAAGGHDRPVYFVGDPGLSNGLWKWSMGMPSWQRIVGPTLAAKEARRFFVDPYDPDLIYIIDTTAIKRSEDGGLTWEVDVSLDRAVTGRRHGRAREQDDGGPFSYAIQRVPAWVGETAVINDMIFDRAEGGTRFAVGNAGVFFTLDGEDWHRLLSTEALPGYPVGAYFDRISDPTDRALYVAMNGRGILRLSPIPAP
jgi:hypothetical protein